MLVEHELDYGLGMEALVTVCSWNMSVTLVWHGCSSDRILVKHERQYGLGMGALVIVST